MRVAVHFCNRQTTGGETTQTAMDATGTLHVIKNGFKLCYTEPEGATVTVSVVDARILLMRQGEIATRLILEENKQHICHCQTPYGEITFPAYTHWLSTNISSRGGVIRALYTMETGDEKAKNEIEILVEEVPTC